MFEFIAGCDGGNSDVVEIDVGSGNVRCYRFIDLSGSAEYSRLPLLMNVVDFLFIFLP